MSNGGRRGDGTSSPADRDNLTADLSSLVRHEGRVERVASPITSCQVVYDAERVIVA